MTDLLVILFIGLAFVGAIFIIVKIIKAFIGSKK